MSPQLQNLSYTPEEREPAATPQFHDENTNVQMSNVVTDTIRDKPSHSGLAEKFMGSGVCLQKVRLVCLGVEGHGIKSQSQQSDPISGLLSRALKPVAPKTV